MVLPRLETSKNRTISATATKVIPTFDALLMVRQAQRRPCKPEKLRPSVRRMIDMFDNVPALVIGRRTDVLAWNRLAPAPLPTAPRPSCSVGSVERPNMVRMVFLDPDYQELYVDWNTKARDAVGYLHTAAVRWADDPKLTSLVGELLVKSPAPRGRPTAHRPASRT